MIRYALICADCDHEFEAWFASSSAYDALAEQNQVTCADCGSARVSKQIMAPSVRTSERRGGEPDPEQFVKEFARKARDFFRAYRTGASGGDVEKQRRRFRAHRCMLDCYYTFITEKQAE